MHTDGHGLPGNRANGESEKWGQKDEGQGTGKNKSNLVEACGALLKLVIRET